MDQGQDQLCATCGFTYRQHLEPVPDDFYLDPAAYHCGSFVQDHEPGWPYAGCPVGCNQLTCTHR